jgi:hypothetical protein
MNNKRLILDIVHLRSFGDVIFNSIFTGLAFILGYFKLIYLDNIDQFVAISFVVFADWILGVSIAIKNKSFETRKAMKVVYYLIAYYLILFSVIIVQKANPSAFFLDETIILPIIFFQFISILKNASILELMPKGLLTELLKNIDSYKHKIVDKISDEQIDSADSEQTK